MAYILHPHIFLSLAPHPTLNLLLPSKNRSSHKDSSLVWEGSCGFISKSTHNSGIFQLISQWCHISEGKQAQDMNDIFSSSASFPSFPPSLLIIWNTSLVPFQN